MWATRRWASPALTKRVLVHKSLSASFWYNPIGRPSASTPQRSILGDVFFLAVFLGGAGLAGTRFTMKILYDELLSTESPSMIYKDTLERTKQSPEVRYLCGERIYGMHDTSYRHHGKLLNYIDFQGPDGATHRRMRFNIEGEKSPALVQVQVKPKFLGFDYDYLFVQVPDNGPHHKTVVLKGEPLFDR